MIYLNNFWHPHCCIVFHWCHLLVEKSLMLITIKPQRQTWQILHKHILIFIRSLAHRTSITPIQTAPPVNRNWIAGTVCSNYTFPTVTSYRRQTLTQSGRHDANQAVTTTDTHFIYPFFFFLVLFYVSTFPLKYAPPLHLIILKIAFIRTYRRNRWQKDDRWQIDDSWEAAQNIKCVTAKTY